MRPASHHAGAARAIRRCIPETLTQTGGHYSATAQVRFRDLVEIVGRVRQAAGSDAAAFAWYGLPSLPGFDALTDEDMVRGGRADAVRAYLADIGHGGYA